MKDPRIVRAYESIEPSEEALSRMMEGVLAAQASSRAGAGSFTTKSVAPSAAWKPTAPRRRKRWLATGAVAAASLAIIIGVGVVALGGFGMGSAAPEAADTAAPGGAEGGESYQYADAEMPLAADSLAMDSLLDGGDAPSADFDTEEYAALAEHGFTSVSSQPLSTFSADVDTASYTNWRRMVNQGVSLGEFPGGAIRVEEFLNYFDYDYPFEDCDCLSPFRVSATIADCPWNADSKLLVLGLVTREVAYAEAKGGNNLVFLIDVSGSMNDPAKLGLLQDSFAYLLEQLNPDDTVSIVTYSGEERVVLDGASASQADLILDAVYGLEAGGSTNGQAGLARAYDLAEKHFIEGGNNRIVLASDGDLNVGMTSESELSDYVSKRREGGVYLTVLGFGDGNYSDVRMETLADDGNYSDVRMETLADDGNGNYHCIDCLAEARKVFGEDLCSTMVTVADDVKLQLEFNPAYVKGYRQVGYENRALAADEFRDDKVDAGEVGAGHAVTVAYELVMADSAMDLLMTDSRYGTEQPGIENGEWFALNVRWKDPGESEAQETSHVFGEEAYTQSPSADWTFAAALIEYCMIATDSRFAGEASVMGVLEKVDAILGEAGDPQRREFRELVANSTE